MAKHLDAKIMIIDDHEIVRKSIRNALSDHGFQVVDDLGESVDHLSLIAQHTPTIVIMDLHMKGLFGLDLLRKLKKSEIDCYCIILSMSSHTWHVRSAFELGASGYVLKSSPLDELFDAIYAVAKGRTFIDSQIDQNEILLKKHSIDDLSEREVQVISLFAQGNSNQEIAQNLFISIKTVETYKSRIMAKLELNGTRDLIVYAIKNGLIDLN